MPKIGCNSPKIIVCINHPLPVGASPETQPLTKDWMEDINQIGGNNWRKIFNIYSKMCFQLIDLKGVDLGGVSTWQKYRDDLLLRSESGFQLQYLMGAEYDNLDQNALYLITGKKCAEELGVKDQLHWLDNDFAQVLGKNMLVCPYFDYRQLSNKKLDTLCRLVAERIEL